MSLILLLSAAAVFIGFLALNYNGVCVREMRRYSDAEIVDLAKARAFIKYRAYTQSPAAEDYLGKSYVTYASQEEFIQKIPDCCKVLTPQEPEWRPELETKGWIRYEGRFRTWVQITMDAGNGFTKTAWDVVDNCGNFRGS
ncbi:hypothetical protein [Aliiroseovarius crassostreae]|uniref:hypothetical protein n=1 Tax=Aliiroseovarius crassostreae TaxID=154981 RepID=UPI003C7CCCDA